MTNSLIFHSTSHAIIIPSGAVKDELHRLRRFVRWLDDTSHTWFEPDLAAYRDYLVERGLTPTSIRAHLSTIRGRYKSLLRDNAFREHLYTLTPVVSPAEKKAFVDELVTRLQNATHPGSVPVKVSTSQDKPDNAHIRLTSEQANTLLNAPSVDSLHGLRDTAIVALLLCTGLREAELCALNVADLRQRLGGALALHVRQGKGAKERLVPYGSLEWVLAIVDTWLQAAAITQGAVFHGFYKGNRRLRSSRLTERAAQDILDAYPVMIDGRAVRLNPHDLRRTYARRLYEAHVDLLAIQQNLGHSDSKTTLGYIGQLDSGARRPPAVYSFDLSKLQKADEGGGR
jgi:site-specific recombinase XerD